MYPSSYPELLSDVPGVTTPDHLEFFAAGLANPAGRQSQLEIIPRRVV